MNTVHLIDEPGTAEAVWREWPALAELPEIEPDGWRSAVILAAHPNDEILGAGGTIARPAARGTRLRLVAVTDGEAFHPGHPDPAGLARRRATETAAAFASWEGNLHDDHEATGRAACLAGVPACQYPVWMWQWAQPADPRVPWADARRVPLPARMRERQQAAVACFASQLEARRTGVPPMLSADFLNQFARDCEVFFPVEARS